ncbi:hypothetical protein L1987_61676 [Smallanthus sonchifolius]|uniref:Uncharacterized protein n=1 Tax=Smallanthus sonchifolius TaxID=185202 RepID=A0ACB9C8B4_9ASTR|nr:hypothetical protein L1987_61676 [Smallanthus sonchifolius]
MMANLSLDGGKRGKPHQTQSREIWMAKRIVRKVRDFKRKSKNNFSNQFVSQNRKMMSRAEKSDKNDLEKIKHASEMLWVELEKEHQEQCKSENTVHVESYETFIEFLVMLENHEQVMNNKESTKTRATTPTSEPEEDEVYYEDQAILDARMVGSYFVGTGVLTADQFDGSCGTSNMEIAESEAMKDVVEESENQSNSSSEELHEDEDDSSEDLVIITNDDFLQCGK